MGWGMVADPCAGDTMECVEGGRGEVKALRCAVYMWVREEALIQKEARVCIVCRCQRAGI